MDHFTPFASPYANVPPSWHHGAHFDSSAFHDDSGYASEDYEFLPFLSLDPDKIHFDNNQVDRDFPRARHHRAAAFVNAQWSHPTASRAYQPSHDPLNDSWRTYDLPQPLSFEQQRNNYASGSRLKPATFYNPENFGPEHGRTPSRWDLEENTSPLDFEEHRARVPNTLPSLSNRIESETDRSSSSSGSIRHGFHSPKAKSKDPQFRGSPTSAEPHHRTTHSVRSSARSQRQHQSPSRDAQLAIAWQQLYQERTEFEKEKRALRKKKKAKALPKRQDWPRSGRRNPSDDADRGSCSGDDSADGTAKSDESA